MSNLLKNKSSNPLDINNGYRDFCNQDGLYQSKWRDVNGQYELWSIDNQLLDTQPHTIQVAA